jgi:hypothetical protein
MPKLPDSLKKFSSGSSALWLNLKKTPKGILVWEMQTLGGVDHNSADAPYHFPFLNTKIGAGVGLEALKALYPNEAIHVSAPEEVKKRWGKDSRFKMETEDFFRFVSYRYSDKRYEILRRMFFEHPQLVRMAAYYGVPDGTVAQIKDDLDARKAKAGKTKPTVPGTKLLRRVTADFSKYTRRDSLAEGDDIPLGKRQIRGYYTTVPRKHGFGEVRTVDFGGELGRLRVRTYEPTGKPGELAQHWQSVKLD